MPEFIFTMQGVSRVHPPDKRVLENITLAFFHGAKIGVIGSNGSGKSSLIRIMAGVDKDFLGEAHPAPGTCTWSTWTWGCPISLDKMSYEC